MNRQCQQYDCCDPQVIHPDACGCCEGVEIVTPLSTYNRPGLPEIKYRIGTHVSFMETMIARLTTVKGLTTRDPSDPALAMLDAWATVGDVLTFYQERIANEGYLRTATERRSVQEMAKLVAYSPRPGVSASVLLAYTVDGNHKEEMVIPAGSRVQSIPGPGELPQAFETSENLKARSQWNNLKPRLTRPQTAKTIRNSEDSMSSVAGSRVYLKGININLEPNDPLLIDFGDEQHEFCHVVEVIPDADADRTLVKFQFDEINDSSATLLADTNLEEPEPEPEPEPELEPELGQDPEEKRFDDVELITELSQRPSIQPRNTLRLERKLEEQLNPKAGTSFAVASVFTPALKDTLATAVANASAAESNVIKVYALRLKASLFGHNMSLPPCSDGGANDNDSSGCVRRRESCFDCISRHFRSFFNIRQRGGATTHMALAMRSVESTDENVTDSEKKLALDAEYKELSPGTWAAIDDGTKVEVFKIEDATSETLGGLLKGELEFFSTCPPITVTEDDSGNQTISKGEPARIKSTIVTLDKPWRDPQAGNDILRNMVFYGQSEELELADEPIEEPVCGGADDFIELDGFYDGIKSGRWAIVSGEREIEGTSGVRFSELAMISSVRQDLEKVDGKPKPDEKIHTYIRFANNLAYCFKRDTVKIYGNVVKATHGETRQEVLGAGDGSKVFQSFDLKQEPLTHVSALNPAGIDSTLSVFINDVRWHESDSLTSLHSDDRQFITKTDNENKTTVIFGNGKNGARLPTGIENVKAEYRSGIGKQGNVKVEQISLLATRPLGVKEVINPLRASGGADRENRDQMRKNAPLAVKALDRLVSVQDYEDFSRVYAGVGKAYAAELSNGRQQIVHVTIAGVEDIPIDDNADLFQNLHNALHEFGDPQHVIQLATRELMLIVLEADVAIHPDYLWESVVAELREQLLDAFSFEHRELGQDVVLSEVISVMQSVRGVTYVDVNIFGGIPEKIAGPDGIRRLMTPDEITEQVKKIAEIHKVPGRPESRLAVNLAGYDRVDKDGNQIESSEIRPAQLAYLSREITDTLLLNQIK